MRLNSRALAFFSCFSLFIGAFASVETPSLEHENPTKKEIFVKKLKGSAKYRRAHSSIWHSLSVDQKLKPGDVIFTEKDSRVFIQFDSNESAIEVPSHWLYHVKDTIPQWSKIHRHAHVVKASGEIMTLDEVQSHPPTNQTKLKMNHPKSWLGIKRKHLEFNLQSPKENFQLNALVFPASFGVELPDNLLSDDFSALVWNFNQPQRPILNLKINRNQNLITLPEPGKYILSIVSNSEESISIPINIDANFLRRSTLSKQIKENLSNETHSSIFVD